jgi:Domain of unknown function (DUF4160)
MAVFKRKCANAVITINDRDHPPPHCHVRFQKGMVRVNILTLEVYRSKKTLPANIRHCLLECQEDMIVAWDNVTIDPDLE